MATLTLPSSPAPNGMTIDLVKNGNVLTSALGSDDQAIYRNNARYALTFMMPAFSYVQSMEWDDLFAIGDLVVMKVHQPGFDTGTPGTPRVNGAGQIGTSLIVDGLNAGYQVRKGQFFTLTTQGRRFLYRAAASVTANGSGQATIVVRTPLRRPPSDNDVIEMANPVIEGFITDLGEYTVDTDRLVKGLRFTIKERA